MKFMKNPCPRAACSRCWDRNKDRKEYWSFFRDWNRNYYVYGRIHRMSDKNLEIHYDLWKAAEHNYNRCLMMELSIT